MYSEVSSPYRKVGVKEKSVCRMTVVEGSYSMHPALGEYYDLAVWVDIDENAQRARIEARNSPAFAQRFLTEWIPLEQAYFTAFDTAARCDLRVEVQL